MNVRVIPGDISRIQSDALITAINSSGMWFGGIDRVIQQNAGSMFHDQARGKSLSQGTTVYAPQTAPHNGGFEDVIFVVDDLEAPLRTVIRAGLDQANTAGAGTVSLPMIRTGVMLGAVEETREEALREIVQGVKDHLSRHSSLESITFVVYNDPSMVAEFQRMLNTQLA